jgi:hypothetical protein
VSADGPGSACICWRRLNLHASQEALLDRDFGGTELLNRPGIGGEVRGRTRYGEGGWTGGYCKRQQKLIGKVQFDGRTGAMMLVESRNRLIRNGFGRLSLALCSSTSDLPVLRRPLNAMVYGYGYSPLQARVAA